MSSLSTLPTLTIEEARDICEDFSSCAGSYREDDENILARAVQVRTLEYNVLSAVHADATREINKLHTKLAAAEQRAETYRTLVGELVGALEKIKAEEGRVCDDYGHCQHTACASSYNAWAIADAALAKAKAQKVSG